MSFVPLWCSLAAPVRLRPARTTALQNKIKNLDSVKKYGYHNLRFLNSSGEDYGSLQLADGDDDQAHDLCEVGWFRIAANTEFIGAAAAAGGFVFPSPLDPAHAFRGKTDAEARLFRGETDEVQEERLLNFIKKHLPDYYDRANQCSLIDIVYVVTGSKTHSRSSARYTLL